MERIFSDALFVTLHTVQSESDCLFHIHIQIDPTLSQNLPHTTHAQHCITMHNCSKNFVTYTYLIPNTVPEKELVIISRISLDIGLPTPNRKLFKIRTTECKQFILRVMHQSLEPSVIFEKKKCIPVSTAYKGGSTRTDANQ